MSHKFQTIHQEILSSGRMSFFSQKSYYYCEWMLNHKFMLQYLTDSQHHSNPCVMASNPSLPRLSGIWNLEEVYFLTTRWHRLNLSSKVLWELSRTGIPITSDAPAAAEKKGSKYLIKLMFNDFQYCSVWPGLKANSISYKCHVTLSLQ